MYIKKYNINKLNQIILYMTAYAFLWLGYVYFIIPYYGYSGFYLEINSIKILESIFAIILIVMMLPVRFNRVSDFLLHIQFLFPVFPMALLYGASDYPRTYFYMVVFAFIIIKAITLVSLPKIKLIKVPLKHFMYGLLTICAISIALIIALGGIKYLNFNILKVYEFRQEAAENLPILFRYLSPIMGKVFLPCLLILSIQNKKWTLALMAITGSILMFALMGNKGPLIYPFVVIVLYWMLSKNNAFYFILYGYISVIIVTLLAFSITDKGILFGSFTVRRAYFVPANLNYLYYDFFSQNELVLFSLNKITFGLIDYPYSVTPGHLIGEYYFKKPDMNANTGWLGAGYMHMGLLGVLVYSIIIGFLFSFIDTYTKGKNKELIAAILFTPLFALFQSTDLPTVFVTHGLVFALILIVLFPKRGNKFYTKPQSYYQNNIRSDNGI